MRLISFDDDFVEPPAFPVYRDDAPGNEGAQVRKPSFSPGEMRTTTTARGLLLTDTASTTMRTIFFPLPPLSWSLGENSGRTDRTNSNQLAPPCWRKAIEIKPRQTLVYDPDGCSGHLRGCPFPRGRRAFLRGGVRLERCNWYPRLERLCLTEDFNIIFQDIGVDRYFPDARKTTGSIG